MSKPAQISYYLRPGTTFSDTLTLYTSNPDGTLGDPVDLTEYDGARMQLRLPDGTMLADMTTDGSNPMIVLGGESIGDISMNIPATITAAFPESKVANYDIELYKGAIVETPFEGEFTLGRRVTEDE